MNNHNAYPKEQIRIAMHGCLILFLGLASGIGFSYAATVATIDSELYGTWRFAHTEGILNGLLVMASAAIYPLIYQTGKAFQIAKWLLLIGCYANIIGPILTALFIGHRVIIPETAFEAFVVYGFYTPGTLPFFSLAIFTWLGFRNSKN